MKSEKIEMIIEKYRKECLRRVEDDEPIGDVCGYCRTVGSRSGKDTCNKCGAPMPVVFGYVFGIPVYDKDDYVVIRAIQIRQPWN